MRTLSAGRVASRTSVFLFSRGHARKFLFTALAAILLAQTSLAAGVAGSARLIRERRGHTATAIGGGKVLVAGGQNLSGALADVEIFDAATGTFTVAARLLAPRAEHTATRLADGRLFLVGGRGTEALTSTEFFDPARNVFSSGPSLNSPRFGHTATLLPDGRVVVIGGNAAGTAEIFDPRAGTFTALPCHLSEPRSFHAAVRLLDGSILIAGGLSVDGKILRSAEVLHPDTLECEPIGNMFAARARFTLRMLPDGKVQAIGGDAERTMELFNPLGYFSSLGHLAGTASSEAAALRNPGRIAILGPNARPISEIGTADAGGRATIRPVQSLLDRLDYSITEVPESGFAIAAGGVSSAGRYQQTAVLFDASAATVTTDQTDYAPGQTVTITGTGWLPGETVTLNIHRDTNNPPDTVLSAVADANGDITNSEYVCQNFDAGVTFLLTATGQTSGYTAQTTFTDNKNYTVAFTGSAGSGTVTGTSVVNVDTVSCTSTAGVASGDCLFNGVDNNDTLNMTATAAGGSSIGTWTLPVGFTIISGCATGNTSCSVNNNNTNQSPIIVAFNASVATTTTVTSSANPSVFGQGVTFTATVTRTTGTGTPTGSVQFNIDGNPFGAPVALGAPTTSTSATAVSGSTSSLSVGTHTVTAEYIPTGSFTASTGTLTPVQTVDKANTTTTITSDTPDPSVVGQPVSIDYTVTANAPGSGTPTGNVTVTASTGETCTGTVAAGTCSITFNSTGARNLTAVYAGDTNFNTSTSAAVSHTVNKAEATTTITSDTPDPSVVGQPVVINYTVTATAPGSGTPTGNVTVTANTGETCTATVAAGTCSITFNSAGARTLTASYAGDANFNASTSTPPTAHQVNKGDTTATITSDTPDPSVTGQSYTVSVTVAPTAPAAGTPGGTVNVADGTGGTCTITLAAGAGSCSLTSTTTGAKTLTASYVGDSNFNPSSDTEAHQVDKGDTTTTITSDTPDPSVVGQPVPVNYTVTVNAPAAGTPTGNVTVTASTGETCTGTVAAGTCSITFTSAGAKTLTAVYAGDANFNTSTSAAEPHTVNKADTTTTITSDTPDPSVVGQPVPINYTVTVNAPGAGTPTGNVTVTASTGETCTGTVAAGTCSITFTSAGAKTLTAVYAGDANFNTSTSAAEPHTVNKADTTTTITSDAPDPSVVGQPVPVHYTVTVNAPGAGTPTGNVTVTANTGETCTGTVAAGTCSVTFTSPGARTLTAVYAGDTNFNGSTSAAESHQVDKANTTTTITSDAPDPSVVGQAVLVGYTVTVNAPGAGTPTGNVTVTVNTGETCTGTVAAGSCSITFATAGVRTLTATYLGDINFNPSTSAPPTAHQVDKGDTTTTITSDLPDPSVIGQSYTVSVTVAPVAPAAGTPGGTVNVSDGTGGTCTITLAAGAGSCLLTSTTAGAKTLTATYGGDANFNGSNDTESHQVDKGDTTTTITSDSPDPAKVGQPYTVSVTVAPVAPAVGTPGGTVNVGDGTDSCIITLAGGTGSCLLTSTTAGAKTLTATYGGDANFNGSSDTESHQVDKGDTTTAITSDAPDPSVVGQPVPVNYTVSVVAPAAGTPTGNVTVTASTGETCTGTVAAGTCSITFTSAGAKTLTAVYAGDANFNTSTSAAEPHTVNKADTTTTITSDAPDPSVVGQPVPINYSVTVNAPGAGTPTGNVTVTANTGETCSGTVAAGTCSITFNSTGTRTLTAVYAGDTNFNGSTSAAESHTVDKANTTTTITSDAPDPSVVGQAVLISYTVTVNAPGAGTPTGSVTVTANTGETCTGTVAAGSCSITFATAGVRTLTATYLGDTNFNGSTSAAESHQVNVRATATTVTLTPATVPEGGPASSVSVTVTDVESMGTKSSPTGTVTFSSSYVGDTFTSMTCVLAPTGADKSGCSVSVTGGDNGAHTITANYPGSAVHAASSGTNTLTVTNVAPTVGPITPTPGGPQPMNSTISFNASFSDPGKFDTFTAVWNWDDGTTSSCPPNSGACNITWAAGSGTVTGSHTFAAAGVYSVTLTVTDDDGDSGASTYQFVVVYDPNGGFVTGGGWINSPAGSYADDPSLVGKANFGFVSKYQTGKNATTIPTGETEFQFQTGNLNFHSSMYDNGSLVISGYKATYRGTGTINGTGSYRFLVVAYDGDRPGGGGVDRFRIKITNGATTVYDNRMGVSEDIDSADPTALGGGSIVIHK